MKSSIKIFVSMLFLVSCFNKAATARLDSTLFLANPLLSRPTDNSVMVTVVPKNAIQIFYEYGTVPGTYTAQTDTVQSTANVPVKKLLINLSSDTRYFYRIRYKTSTSNGFLAGEECDFTTRRKRGESFSFAITADSHLYDKKGIPVMMNVSMQNILEDHPDFVIDLGDTFGDDHTPTTTSQSDMMTLHSNFLPYITTPCKSAHFFFCLGNHEGENGYYYLQTPPNNLSIYATLARKYYYSNPVPDDFYTGNNSSEGYGIGLPENYYAWEWGDALFVVLDVYRPDTINDKPQNWDWTLGRQQYEWFRQTVESSNAKYKFVFAHHLRGQGRGAANLANQFEWGGYDGTTYAFPAKRPGWEAPVHQLMVHNGVNVFFQGHDHLFAQEALDGIIYQECPMTADSTYMIGMLANADAYKSNQMNGTGYIRVTVSPDSSKVEYVRSYLPRDTSATQKNHGVAFSYTLSSRTTGVEKQDYSRPSIILEQNYPNPFNPSTDIRYSIPAAQYVTLKVFDVNGKEVATLVNSFQQAGIHKISFSATTSLNNYKGNLPSGIYFYQLRTGETVITKKAIFLK
jgi:hypothetical protein